MSNIETEEQIDNLSDTYYKADENDHGLEPINRELEAFLFKANNVKDATDGVFDFLKDLSDSAQEEFDKLLAGDSDKKRFARVLSRIFALLLNTKSSNTSSTSP